MKNHAKLIYEVLKKHPGEWYSVRTISKWIIEEYPTEIEEKREKSIQDLSDDEKMTNALDSEFAEGVRKSLRQNYPDIEMCENPKWQFRYSGKSAPSPKPDSSATSNKSKTFDKEESMYPILGAFMKSQVSKVHCMRINEKTSSKKQGPGSNQWLHPDVVGLEGLSTGDFAREVKDSLEHFYNKTTTKLWSFEVKKEIASNNVREYFFQTVSNSSWANQGYLVAGKIDKKALLELHILCDLHGIGYIELDAENPGEGSIVIPAKERPNLAWRTINRIATTNPDFKEYLERVTNFNKTGRINKPDWY